jgi:hypothetical protein
MFWVYGKKNLGQPILRDELGSFSGQNQGTYFAGQAHFTRDALSMAHFEIMPSHHRAFSTVLCHCLVLHDIEVQKSG